MGVLIITHYQRILHLVEPTRVVRSCSTAGSSRRAAPSSSPQLESEGYANIKEAAGVGAGGHHHGRHRPARRAREFPTLDREGVAYLDTRGHVADARTSCWPRWTDYYRHLPRVGASRTYPLASEATDLFEGARKRIAAFVNWAARDTVFTRNASEALNLVAHGWGRRHVGPGDRILVTRMEHHSNIVPW